jgi:hypothetical protein
MGVDDFRGDGGDLQDMMVKNDVTEPDLPELMRRRIDQHERDTSVLDYLRRVAADDGLAIATHRAIGTAVGRDKNSARAALESLEHQGLLRRVDSSRWGTTAKADRRPMTAVQLDPSLVPEREMMTLGEHLRS